MITRAAIKHTTKEVIETILALEMSALGMLAVPLSYNKFYSTMYTI